MARQVLVGINRKNGLANLGTRPPSRRRSLTVVGWYQDYLQANAVAVYYSPTKKFYALLVDCAGEEILRTSTTATNGQPRETENLIKISENPLCRGCLKSEKGVDGS